MNENFAIIYVCGFHSLCFAIYHSYFWKIFDWKKDLKKVSVPTRAITQILNLRLIYFFLAISFLCFVYPDDLQGTQLGHCILAVMSLFWIGRLVEQYLFLPYNKGLVHLLSATFALGAALFALPLYLL